MLGAPIVRRGAARRVGVFRTSLRANYGQPGGALPALRPSSAVVDDTQVKVIAWHDNEWGYSSRLVDLVQRVLVPAAVGA
jgi:hypothetical protein